MEREHKPQACLALEGRFARVFSEADADFDVPDRDEAVVLGLCCSAMAEKRPCGKHIELSSNSAVKITQCPCGTVHVTLSASGVTLRMNEEALRGVTGGFIAASDKIEEVARPTIN
jgi:hypothetical protein